MIPPAYFERIRFNSAELWKQLESNPVLAGPWHQLFMQVQSPRHVLSELLQNADDAGATEASVCIQKEVFIFTHNGEDFTEEHLTSLCRFGFSNKKALHTIGFRGIGFKSTFSLGDRVEVHTPTLSVAFDRKRFTEPVWIKSDGTIRSQTEVRVRISDAHRIKEVEKNLAEWTKSPTSLLFFKNIRRIRVKDHEIYWKSLGAGPVAYSEWITLSDELDKQYLLVRSTAENFPEDALNEIKQERALAIDDDTVFPPCQVELVVGIEGRIFVVLPTGVKTSLPFACNAPFIQDPARSKIKGPEISPTNRWLLGRVGKLAASLMLNWLNRTDIDLAGRCAAYALLPDVTKDENSIEGLCETIVDEAFSASIESTDYLISDMGELKAADQIIILPEFVLNVWSAEDASALLDSLSRPPLCRQVSDIDRKKLSNRGIEHIDIRDVLEILQETQPPRPKTWEQLFDLWYFLAEDITAHAYRRNIEHINIIPVQGKEVLFAAKDVVRLGERRLLQSDQDWGFLSDYLLVMNQNWLRYLTDQRRIAEEQNDQVLVGIIVEEVYPILKAMGFEDASDVSKVCERVAGAVWEQRQVSLSVCIRFAQIAAKLGATVGSNFRFQTQDGINRLTKEMLFCDADGKLEDLLPENWRQPHLLHSDYLKTFISCTKEEWDRWILSGRAGLHTAVPPVQKKVDIRSRSRIENEVRMRGWAGRIVFPYSKNNFIIEDWDFDNFQWNHWQNLYNQDKTIWGQLVERIFAQSETFWQKSRSAKALQVATNGNTRLITYEDLLPTWILKLRELPCLPDTRGFYHKPAELLRRTPETESLLDVEPFVHGRLDNEAVRPLLKLLGVQSVPTGPDQLLARLRALAKADNPPVYEVEKWYSRLDRMMDVSSTDDAKKIKQAFAEERLILTDNNRWEQAAGVFLLSNEEDVPGAEIIKPSVRELALWRKIGVAERPTADLAIQWLKSLPSNQTLPQEETNRIRALLTRHALLIWQECEHWLNLAGEWAPVETLEYALTLQSLIPWKHLHEWVKKKTADFQRLPVEISEVPPFSILPALAAQIEDRFHTPPHFRGRSERKQWLNKLGSELCRISLDSIDETERIRVLAARLADTVWQTAPSLEIIPYINGVPGGTPRQAEATWLDKVLYVEQRPLPKLARNVAQELGRNFRRQDIGDAIKLCFERQPEFVLEYMEENFKLVSRQEIEHTDTEAIAGADTIDVLDQTSTTETSVGVTGEVTEYIDEETKIKDFILEQETKKPEHKEDEGVEVATDQSSLDDQEEVELVPRRPVKPATPSLIERFAEGLGYKKSGEERFLRADGSWICKANGSSRFPWEMRSAAGEVVRYFWPKDHCLEREALQIEADVWGLIDKFPEMYALVLSNLQDSPVEVTGECIRTMRDKGELTLYPATYRIVYKNEG